MTNQWYVIFVSIYWLNHQPVILFHIIFRGSRPWFSIRTLQDRPGWSRTWDVDLGEPQKRSMDEQNAIGFAAAATWLVILGTHIYWSFIGDITHGIMLHL
jgi:hypothetical protein